MTCLVPLEGMDAATRDTLLLYHQLGTQPDPSPAGAPDHSAGAWWSLLDHSALIRRGVCGEPPSPLRPLRLSIAILCLRLLPSSMPPESWLGPSLQSAPLSGILGPSIMEDILWEPLMDHDQVIHWRHIHTHSRVLGVCSPPWPRPSWKPTKGHQHPVFKQRNASCSVNGRHEKKKPWDFVVVSVTCRATAHWHSASVLGEQWGSSLDWLLGSWGGSAFACWGSGGIRGGMGLPPHPLVQCTTGSGPGLVHAPVGDQTGCTPRSKSGGPQWGAAPETKHVRIPFP